MLVTRFELFLRARGLRPIDIARTSGESRQHVLRLRTGKSLPTRRSLVAVRDACASLTRELVTAESLFERGDALLSSSRQRLSDFHIADLRALASILERERDDAFVQAIAATSIASETSFTFLVSRAHGLIDRSPRSAADLFVAAIAMASQLPDSSSEMASALTAHALNEHANVLRHLGDYDRALANLERAAASYARVGFCEREAANVEYTRATIFLFREEHDAATVAVRAAQKHFRAAGDMRRAGHSAIVEAGIHFERGDVDKAAALFHRLRNSGALRRDRDAVARVWLNLGACEIRRGDQDAARRWLVRASAAFREQRNVTEFLRTRWNMATYVATFSDVGRGIRLLDRVERGFTALGMNAEAACVGLDGLELLAQHGAEPATFLERGRQIARTLVRARMRLSSASILALLRNIRTPDDARVAAMRLRSEMRRYAALPFDPKADVAADPRDDAKSI